MKFLLDTNFLMIPGQFRVDIYEQLRGFGPADLYVTELSVRELDKLAMGHGRNASHARVALLLMRKEGVKIIPSGKTSTSRLRGTLLGAHQPSWLRLRGQSAADEAIRRIAKREGMVVCTADKALKASLRKRGIRVVVLRQRKYLGFEE